MLLNIGIIQVYELVFCCMNIIYFLVYVKFLGKGLLRVYGKYWKRLLNLRDICFQIYEKSLFIYEFEGYFYFLMLWG